MIATGWLDSVSETNGHMKMLIRVIDFYMGKKAPSKLPCLFFCNERVVKEWNVGTKRKFSFKIVAKVSSRGITDNTLVIDRVFDNDVAISEAVERKNLWRNIKEDEIK